MEESQKVSHRTTFKRNKYKIFFIFVAVLWIISTFLTLKAFRQPLELEQKSLLNTITEKTVFEYNAEVIPCTLYPSGGVVTPEGHVMTAITSRINIHMESWVTSQKPVEVKGSQEILLKLVAENLWEREFIISNKSQFNLTGDKNQLIMGDYGINPHDFINYIDKVEEETKIRAGRYYIKIKPVLEGEIVYKDTTLNFDPTPELVFEIGNNQLSLVKNQIKDQTGDVPKNKLEFSKNTPIEIINIIPQPFVIFGKSFSPIKARVVLATLSIITFAIIIKILWSRRKELSKSMTESQKIDKKYSSRIIKVDQEYKLDNPFYLESFKTLLKIADEKEQPILRFRTRERYTSYCVIDGRQQYVYTAVDPLISSTDISGDRK